MAGVAAAYACERYAVHARDGRGVKKSKATYKKYLAKSCKFGGADSCGMRTGLVNPGG